MADLLRRLAVPRLHGSPGAEQVRAAVVSRLKELGYALTEQSFRFSKWPVRTGVPLLGLALGAGTVLAALEFGAGRLVTGLLLLLAAALLALCFSLGCGSLVLHLPWSRGEGTNLLARMPGAAARFLIVAHRDSKSQPIPLALRIFAAVAILLAWATLVVLGLRLVAGLPVGPGLLPLAGGAGLLGGLVLGCCGVGNRSAGALDNASGLAALLRIAERERGHGDVALLVTDAEEYGLAGARAAAHGRTLGGAGAPFEAVINLDGLDDQGDFFLLGGPRPGEMKQWPVVQSLVAAGRRAGRRIRRRPVPPGLMIDHLPLRAAGHQAITLMRGGLRSLARVHRPADDLTRLAGDGVVLAASLVSSALDQLRAGRDAGGARRVAASAAND